MGKEDKLCWSWHLPCVERLWCLCPSLLFNPSLPLFFPSFLSLSLPLLIPLSLLFFVSILSFGIKAQLILWKSRWGNYWKACQFDFRIRFLDNLVIDNEHYFGLHVNTCKTPPQPHHRNMMKADFGPGVSQYKTRFLHDTLNSKKYEK